MRYPEYYITCKYCEWYKHDPKYPSCYDCREKVRQEKVEREFGIKIGGENEKPEPKNEPKLI